MDTQNFHLILARTERDLFLAQKKAFCSNSWEMSLVHVVLASLL